jgi:hypothetical protein
LGQRSPYALVDFQRSTRHPLTGQGEYERAVLLGLRAGARGRPTTMSGGKESLVPAFLQWMRRN